MANQLLDQLQIFVETLVAVDELIGQWNAKQPSLRKPMRCRTGQDWHGNSSSSIVKEKQHPTFQTNF